MSKIVRYGMHEGVRIPVEIQTVKGGDTTRVHVVDYQLDVPISESEFKPPYIYR